MLPPRSLLRLAMHRGVVHGVCTVAIYIVREAVSHLVCDGGGVGAAVHTTAAVPCEERWTLQLLAG